MTDVLIVGAGPVGLMLAAELARYGVAVRIIDQSAHATQTSKALVVWPRTLELMDRMGCGGAFLAAGLRAHGATIRGGDAVLGHARFDDVASPYPFALMIPQSETERLLGEHLSSLGVEVERNVRLDGVVQREAVVEARLTRADGRTETCEVAWLAGCDGAHSSVRHALGVDFHGSTQSDEWLLADVRLEGAAAPPPDEVAPYLHRDGPFVIFPIPGGRARVVADVGKADLDKPPTNPTLEDVQALIDRRAGGGFRAYDPVWLTHFRINERKVAEYRAGRIFLAGDAAHIHSPAGGQGMNTGMQDAINLAWKLAMVIRGDAAPALLDSYSPERSAVGDMVLRNAAALTSVSTVANPAAQALRNVALRFLLGLHAVQHRMATTMSEIDIAYPHSPLSSGAGAGARLAPEQYGGPPPGSGRAPRFVLHAADANEARALIDRFPMLLEAAPRVPPAGAGLLIVRPDGYVGFSSAGEAWTQASAYLYAIAASAFP